MSDFTAWYLNQLDTHGLLVVLAVQAGLLHIAWSVAKAIHRARTRRTARRWDEQAVADHAHGGIRVAENYANSEAAREAIDTNQPARREMP